MRAGLRGSKRDEAGSSPRFLQAARGGGASQDTQARAQPFIVWPSPKPPHPLFALFKFVLALGSSLVLGLLATMVLLERSSLPGAVHAGVWTVWPKIGSLAIDPYQRAAVARNGEVPLGLSEGLMFIARTDAAGAPLSGKCAYHITGPVPAGRFWTLTPMRRDGSLIENGARRYGFSSQEIVRSADGKFEISLARAVAPGNWLPLGDVANFELALRIYDTTLSATAANLDKTLMPSVKREACA